MTPIRIVWHGKPCPLSHLPKVEADLAGLLGKTLQAPEKLIFHCIFLGSGAAVTAWGETGDNAFHAEFHAAPTKRRADKALEERLRQAQGASADGWVR